MRFFFSDLRRNLIKILCLTVGLSIGFLLIAKVYFESTYDTWFDASSRTYLVTETAVQNGELMLYDNIPGAIAPGMKRYCPQVEAATRISTLWNGDLTFTTGDGRKIGAVGIILADSAFFEVFPTRIISGNPRESLEIKNSVFIPKSVADKIGGDVEGMQISMPEYWPGYIMTVAGVYEDFPRNSTVKNAIYLSMPTIADFTYDGRDNWTGNDRYRGFIRLSEGTDAESLRPNIDRMVNENCDPEAIEISHLNFGTKPLQSLHKGESSVKTTIWILSMLAIVMLMCAGLNYLLVVFGQMGKRGKEMAVRKCYGTSNIKIFFRVILESLFFLSVSAILAVLFVECFAEECRKLLGYSPGQLFSTGHVWLVELIVIAVILIITGAIPAWIYCRTPVAHAFRGHARSHKGWKLALLSLQFFATSLLICILVLVVRQYSMLTSMKLGYDYENIGFLDLTGVPSSQRNALVADLSKIPGVEGVSSAEFNFTHYQGGNNVWLDENVENQFNVADLYWVNPNFFDVMGIKVEKGEPFGEMTDTVNYEAMVDSRFVESLKKYFGVTESDIPGRKFKITEHRDYGSEEYAITGVFNTLTIGGVDIKSEDTRPQVMFPSSKVLSSLYIRFSEITPDVMTEAGKVVKNVLTDQDRYITPYKVQVRGMTEEVERFGTSVMIVGMAILVIALIGLVGYVGDEVSRRSKEIAIRKVTGYRASQVITLFCREILIVAIPSMIAGGAVAMIVGRNWLSQFSRQVSLSPLSLALCILTLLAIIVAVVIFNCHKVAAANPVDHLRNE